MSEEKMSNKIHTDSSRIAGLQKRQMVIMGVLLVMTEAKEMQDYIRKMMKDLQSEVSDLEALKKD